MSAPREPRNADDLLKWSIAASNQEGGSAEATDASIQQIAGQITSGKRPDLSDPALYDALMGKSEAQMMREELSVALDGRRSEEDRVQALDNFEMLIESIDNANNISSMKMWEPLVALLTASNSTPSIQLATLWILGTAVQNNDKAQMAILEFAPLKPIISLLVHGADGQVRSKAMYALSGILKHNAKAVQLFTQEDGWTALRGALLDPDVSLRRKAAFLVNTLLLQDDSATTNSSTAAASSTGTQATTGSTAVAPMPGGDLPAAPLEQPPATHREGIPHPAIPPLLISSRLLSTLIVSLLPASMQAELPAEALDGIDTAASAGPDGDIELRDDLDYAEKASRACLTFMDRIDEAKQHGDVAAFEDVDHSVRTQTKALLQALAKELHGRPIEPDADAEVTSRWQELGLQKAELDAFQAGVQAL